MRAHISLCLLPQSRFGSALHPPHTGKLGRGGLFERCIRSRGPRSDASRPRRGRAQKKSASVLPDASSIFLPKNTGVELCRTCSDLGCHDCERASEAPSVYSRARKTNDDTAHKRDQALPSSYYRLLYVLAHF